MHFSIKKKPKQEIFKSGSWQVAIYVQLAKTFHWASRAPLLFFVYMAPVAPTTSAQLMPTHCTRARTAGKLKI
jgi:hypothetical protein